VPHIDTEAPTLTIPRAALALFAGSLVGAALVILSMILPVLILAPKEFAAQWQPNDANFLLLEFLVAWCVFAIGLAIVGVPLWWVCHRQGWRGARAALALGFLATFLASMVTNILPGL
jgi:hypothetical protein